MSKKLLVIGSLAVALIVLAVLISAYNSGSSGSSTNTTVSSSSSATSKPAFAGEDAFINIGITSEQVSNLEQAVEQYLGTVSINPGQVSFNSIEKLSENKNAATPIWTIAFVVQLDNKDTYKAKMDYFNLTGVRLYLYSLDGSKLLYDSQNVGGSPGV